MKILVADDSLTFLSLITASLNNLGHEVIKASDGKTAIEYFAEYHPDLVILDVMMTGMNGFECARRIREINQDDWIPIIFLSASVNDESIAKGIEAGGDDYLTKPYSDVTLEAKIKAMQRIANMRRELLSKTEELKKISTTDMLTGLSNRFHFEKVLVKRMAAAKRHGFNMALLFVDLDHFKSINDSFGHGIGDLLLKDVATRIQKCTRIDDFVARIGGDEFIVILSHIENHREACEVANKIVDEVGKIYNINETVLKVSTSIGVSCYPEQADNMATLVQNADIAMYAAKQLGRNNYQLYTDALSETYKHQLGLEHELKFSIEREELSLVYQPVFDLLSKKLLGAEALARWNHPVYGLISPNIFIPIAEETGLIEDVGRWVLERACMQGARIIESGSADYIISVNVSIHQLMNESFMSYLNQIVDRYRINPKNIELELTESTVITYTQTLKETMRKLHDLGVGIAIDDFGTRYSSLTSLTHLPITTLKIDREFIVNVESDKKNNIIVKSLIALGESLKLKVIAEGVETEEQAQYLILNGCRLGQGNLMMAPLSYDEFIELVEREKKSGMNIK